VLTARRCDHYERDADAQHYQYNDLQRDTRRLEDETRNLKTRIQDLDSINTNVAKKIQELVTAQSSAIDCATWMLQYLAQSRHEPGLRPAEVLKWPPECTLMPQDAKWTDLAVKVTLPQESLISRITSEPLIKQGIPDAKANMFTEDFVLRTLAELHQAKRY
jgi:hypothetical protein